MSNSANNSQAPAGTKRAPSEYFTGTAWVTMLAADNPTNCTVADVTFEPGCRNNWHSRPAGQLLVVTAGQAYYQEKGQPAQLLRAGDTVSIAPGVVHWHGASPKQGMTHISLNVNTRKGLVDWGRAVTDQEYNSYK